MAKPVYKFLDVELVTARREIRRNGEPLAVEPKVYDLLLYLLERRDRSVSKEELQDEIWPKVIVTETALTRCVMKARNAVGDDSQDARVIKTLRSHGYQFIADVEETGADSVLDTTDDDHVELMTIAVLPFVNLSGDPEQDHMANGLTQDIIIDLSRNTWLQVVARHQSLHNSGETPDYSTVATDLGVRYLVEGSIRRYGDKIRISASLIDAATGVREWTERYDQSIDNFFEIQDDISQSIVSSLGSHVQKAEGRRAEKANPDSLNVWGLLHRGMAISWSRFNRESNLAAESMYRRALEIDPDNPKAMAFVSTNVAMKVANGWSEDVAADSAEAFALGEKAVELLPGDTCVLGSFGHTLSCLGSPADAVGIHERALEIDPNNAWIHGLKAYALTGAGHADEAVDLLTRALRLSPRDAATHWYLSMLSWAYLQLQQLDDAARESQRSINSFGGWPVAWATLSVARAGLDQLDDARKAADVALRLDPAISKDGYSRFFRFIVRDEDYSAQLDNWLGEIWPREPSPAS